MSLFIQPRRKVQGLDHVVSRRKEMMYIILILKEDEKRAIRERVNKGKTNQGP